jgi:hypothetical protein
MLARSLEGDHMKRWQHFFGTGELLSLEAIERLYIHARRHARGCVFISHAGPDGPEIDTLITDSIRSDYSVYAVFQYSSVGPMKDHYKQLVLLAMTYCTCAVVACSKHSSEHRWVFAEVDWLLDHRKPVFVLRLDDTSPKRVHPDLGWWGRFTKGVRMYRKDEALQLERRLRRFDIPKCPDLELSSWKPLSGEPPAADFGA